MGFSPDGYYSENFDSRAPRAEIDTFRPLDFQHDTCEGEQQCVVYDYPTLTDDPRHDLEANGIWPEKLAEVAITP